MYIVADYDALADVLRDSRVRVPLPAPIYGRLAHALKSRVQEGSRSSKFRRRTTIENSVRKWYLQRPLTMLVITSTATTRNGVVRRPS